MSGDFDQAKHTVVVSDIHLADAEPPHPKNPLWKRFKRPKHFVDPTFKKFLEFVRKEATGPAELIFNGDIFDFDSVMAIPMNPTFDVNWLERARGLAAEEPKSRFKLKVILKDHPVWVEAVREFILAGNHVVFVIGNHDMELHWPSMQADLVRAFDLPDVFKDNIRFCEWFYVSNKDTLIEHGNQYDAYCMSNNPVNPLIKKGSRIFVRLPFGNLAGKFMLNGMGLMNPHADSSFIKSSFAEYIVFFYRYVMRTQPLLLLTWFWSAMVTLVYSVSEGLLPAMRDPLTIDTRVAEIARKGNASTGMVWALRELHVHPAIFNPFKILRELWLDRAILLGLVVFGSFQIFTFMNVFVSISIWWFVAMVMILMPMFIFYARGVESEVKEIQGAARGMAPLAARITGVKRVIHGHTHLEHHGMVEDIEVINTGTWSPAFHDVECMQPYRKKCFAWIKPTENGTRVAALYEWRDGKIEIVPMA